MQTRALLTTAVVAASAAALAACGAKPVSGDSPELGRMMIEADEAIEEFVEADSSMQDFFDDSYGYAIFPTVGKGAVGVGGAHGDGLVFRRGEVTGTTSLSQGTVGLQLGGQTYREVIFFEDARAYRDFTSGNLELAAQVSAVAATEGASDQAEFDGGMLIFTMARGGLMFEASVGGQSFDFRAID